MSSVFRIVFIAAIAGEVRLPKNLFLFVYFKRKDKLLFQSLIHTVQLLAEFAFYPYYNTNSYPSQLWKSKSGDTHRSAHQQRSPELPGKTVLRAVPRQFLFALLAVLVAVGLYFGLRNVVDSGEIGWICVLAAFPFALCGREGFVLPKSVQDAIPIRRLWPDGIFQFGSKLSKTIRFSDISGTA